MENSTCSHNLEGVDGPISCIRIPEDALKKKESQAQIIKFLRFTLDDIPPWPMTILLGFQMFLAMMVSTISAPFVLAPTLCMAEDDPARGYLLCSILFSSGIATTLQSTLGNRLPLVQDGNTAIIIPILTIMALPEWKCPADLDSLDQGTRDKLWMERTALMQGSLAVASLVQVFIGAFGVAGSILHFISPLTVAPVITVMGLTLFLRVTVMMAKNWAVSIVALVLVTLSAQYLENIGIPMPNFSANKQKRSKFYLFKFFPFLLAMMLTWTICGLMTVFDILPSDNHARTDRTTSLINHSPWFRIPYPGEWGIPTVSASAVIGFLAGSVAYSVESIGNYYTSARISGAPPPPVHAINRGLMVEGLGCGMSGLFGGLSGTTSACISLGTISITKVGSRRVIQVAGVIMVFFGTFSKLGAVFSTIPEPIIGGILCATIGVAASIGVSNLQYVEINSSRNLFIFGVSLMVGLVVPHWAIENAGAIKTGYTELDTTLTILVSNGMLISGLLGVTLDNTIPGTAKERGVERFQRPTHATADNSSLGSYDLPFGMKYIKRHKWTRYVPILPGFQGWSALFRR